MPGQSVTFLDMPKTRFFCLLAALTTVSLTIPAAAQPRYTITELPTLGGAASRGVDVNNSGLVCGESHRAGEHYLVATAWLPPDYQPIYLTGSGGSIATANSVNESGVIVGISDLLELGAYRAAPPGTQAAEVGEMAQHWGSAACITEQGDLCGTWSSVEAQGQHPFMIRAGAFTPLPLLPGGTQGEALAINDAGLAVGWSESGINGGFIRAVRWDAGVATPLAGGQGLNSARAVNAEGWIVGSTAHPTLPRDMATLWVDPQNPIDLGALVPAHWQHWALAINNSRQVVGTSGQRAFLWQAGVMHDLHTLIPPGSNWVLFAANGISDNGLIVGEGLHNGVYRGFLLTPVCTADFNCDGDSGTDQDIEDFFACLGGACCETCGSADFNHDGDTGSDQDIEAFFRVLAGGPC